ncbi:MAG: M20/M25/M40 family metallo-hydrolase [Chloroflexota bacterium]|nr:M20/M25/M40 family metallo-hydrolase [Chloroflexota bacterium]
MPESPGPIALNRDRLLENFIDMLSVDSYYGDEERVAAIIRPALAPQGIRFRNDASGNLIGRWPGRGRRDGLIMLNAHMDTVQPTPTMRPVVDADGVRSDGSSVLGADDKAGLAAIIEAIRAVDEAGLEHAPIELVITVGEELGHIGSKAFDAASIDARTAFVFDAGGPVGTVVLRAPGQIRCTATLHGRAAHAGIEPELGLSAISLLARAVDRMPLGRIDDETTANIGRIEGGQQSNIVAPTARIEAEARSLSEDRLAAQIDAMRTSVADAAADLGGSFDFEEHRFYVAYQLDENEPAVQLADRAIIAAGLTPRHVSTGGGSDAHEFNLYGITSVCLGVGYIDVHTTDEFMPHDALHDITQVAAQLITQA